MNKRVVNDLGCYVYRVLGLGVWGIIIMMAYVKQTKKHNLFKISLTAARRPRLIPLTATKPKGYSTAVLRSPLNEEQRCCFLGPLKLDRRRMFMSTSCQRIGYAYPPCT